MGNKDRQVKQEEKKQPHSFKKAQDALGLGEKMASEASNKSKNNRFGAMNDSDEDY